MYEDILGPVDKIREIKNRKFDLNPPKEENKEEEFGLFEDMIMELDYE